MVQKNQSEVTKPEGVTPLQTILNEWAKQPTQDIKPEGVAPFKKEQILIRFSELSSFGIGERLIQMITSRDGFILKGIGGESPSISGWSSTLAGRGVDIEAQMGYEGWSGLITLTYHDGVRMGFGLLCHIISQVLGDNACRSPHYQPAPLSPPKDWEKFSVGIAQNDGDRFTELKWGWEAWGDYYWTPTEEVAR